MHLAEQLLSDVHSQPGIDVSKLKIGMTILVETATAVFQMTVKNPATGYVEVVSDDPRLQTAKVGRIVGSTCLPSVLVKSWIGKGMRMEIEFKNAILKCMPSIEAQVIGRGWKYRVF